MEIDEADELIECWECGATVSATEDNVYRFSETAVLCFECALQRGGRYDSALDSWTRAPDATGLPDERRPHA